MEIVYKTSRILAFILAVIAVLGILDVIFNIEWNSTFENFTEWEKYDEHFNSNSTLVTLQPIVNILYYVRPILYVGMFLFFLLLKIKMAKGSRLTFTIISGLVSSAFCLCTFGVGTLYIYDIFWIYLFSIVSTSALLLTFCSMLFFFARKSIQQTACIILIIAILLNLLIPVISRITLTNLSFIPMIILYPLAFAFFFYAFSKLGKQSNYAKHTESI